MSTFESIDPSENLSINPFLDPYAPPEGGKMVRSGQPLSRLTVPNIPTLIARSIPSTERITNISLENLITTAEMTPSRAVMAGTEEIGIELNVNLFGESAFTPVAQINPSQASQSSVGRPLPRTYHEAREVLHLITSQRAGSKNTAFSNAEIKTIARNLKLRPTGNKDEVVNRIRTAVIDYFKMQ